MFGCVGWQTFLTESLNFVGSLSLAHKYLYIKLLGTKLFILYWHSNFIMYCSAEYQQRCFFIIIFNVKISVKAPNTKIYVLPLCWQSEERNRRGRT